MKQPLTFKRFKDVCFVIVCLTYLICGFAFFEHLHWCQAGFVIALCAMIILINPMYRTYVRLHNRFTSGA